MNPLEHEKTPKTLGLSELPVDELIHYGSRLGLRLNAKMGQGELLRRIRQRQELLLEMDREAMLDVVVWARRPVRESASKEELAAIIATIAKMNLGSLSDRGLLVLARLRDVPVRDHEPRAEIEARIRACEPLMDRLRRKRREVLGSVINKMVIGSDSSEPEAYRFLPENGTLPSLKDQISDEGVVGGIARKIRGVADDYIREKLDEIEIRLDRKLDEIDQRLAEWRDREIENRLKIIKITLVASILVALLSLGYKYFVSS